jgi:branched-chain amino acid transport system permease protein
MRAPRRPVFWRACGLLAVLAAAAAVPLLASDFQLFRLTNIVIYAIALLGMNILVGYNGQISLGHGAFYAIGAYTAVLLIVQAGVAHWVAVPVAGIVCLVLGFLFSLPLRNLAPVHLAMATFAVGVVLPSIAKWKWLERWTGGGQGLGIDVPAVPFGLPLSFDQWLYLLTLMTMALAFLLASNLLRGRIGRAAIAIRDHPIAAQSMGVDTDYYKAAIFGISAMLTGIAGALAALSFRYIAPGMFGIFVSFGFLIGIAVGGLASLSGAVYGAIFLQYIFLVVGVTARSLQTSSAPLIYGVVLVLFLCFFPHGLAGLVNGAWAWLHRARAKRQKAARTSDNSPSAGS